MSSSAYAMILKIKSNFQISMIIYTVLDFLLSRVNTGYNPGYIFTSDVYQTL